MNGDGLADIVVGTPGFDDLGLYDRGRVLLHPGPLTGSRVDPVWTFDGDQARAQLGYSVAGAGDVDADGFAEIIVGAPFSAHRRNKRHVTPDKGCSVNLGFDIRWGNRAAGRTGAERPDSDRLVESISA